jgi:hypothetical protein
MKSLNFRAVLFDLGSFCFRSAPFSVHVSQNGVEAESGERGMRENCSLFFCSRVEAEGGERGMRENCEPELFFSGMVQPLRGIFLSGAALLYLVLNQTYCLLELSRFVLVHSLTKHHINSE